MRESLLDEHISVSSGFMKVLPRWVAICGIILAVAGELGWIHPEVFPNLLFLIPLVRFPGFVWLIGVGFLLPRSRAKPEPARVAASRAAARTI